MYQPIGLAAGFVVLTLSGLGVRRLIEQGAEKPERPAAIPEHVWNEHLRKKDGGNWLGFLERSLFFAALWSGQVVVIGAWLAFKLASKWEVWKNVVRVPQKPESIDDQNWFAATHTFGSWILQRFWVGTLVNILLAWTAVGVGRYIVPRWW